MRVLSYYTISQCSEGVYKEKGSKFISFAYPVSDENQIKLHLEQLRKKYFDARHHCYAWMLGPERQRYRVSDDGEPNHSAGDPILGQIRSRNLTGVLIVVVRYFGGVKLGVGGLIHAYRTAAEEALNKNVVVEKEVVHQIRLAFDFAATAEAMRLVKEFALRIVEQQYDESCHIVGEISARNQPRLEEKVKLLSAMGTRILLVGT